MTEIDDFKFMSTRMFVIFINFADAFGSVCRKFILTSLEKFSIPRVCHLVEYLCKYPCFQVIGTNELSRVLFIILVAKTGDPECYDIYHAIRNTYRSAIIFIVVVDCIFIPMISIALVSQNLQNGKQLNPLKVQDFADNIALVTHDDKTSRDMISIAETIMAEANLEVKISKGSKMGKKIMSEQLFS